MGRAKEIQLKVIDKKCMNDLTVPIIPFSEIYKMNAGMYKGEKITQAERHVMKE